MNGVSPILFLFFLFSEISSLHPLRGALSLPSSVCIRVHPWFPRCFPRRETHPYQTARVQVKDPLPKCSTTANSPLLPVSPASFLKLPVPFAPLLTRYLLPAFFLMGLGFALFGIYQNVRD